MKTVAYFQSSFLEPIMRFAGRNDIRYYLNGFHVEPAPGGGVLLAATDGHTLIVARDPEGWADGGHIIAPEKRLVSASKTKKAGMMFLQRGESGAGLGAIIDEGVKADENGSLAYVAESPMSIAMHIGLTEFIDGKYPNYRSVIAKAKIEDRGVSGYCDIVANAGYLARFKDAFDVMQGLPASRSYGGIRLQAFNKDESIVITPTHGELEAVGLVMPMRCERGSVDLRWMGEVSTSKPVTKPRVRVRAGESIENGQEVAQ